MKKFLEELKKASMNTYDIAPNNTKAKERFGEIMRMYKKLEGQDVLYTSKHNKESRVVTVEYVGPRFITISYEYYGNICGRTRTSVGYGSLISGDDVLEEERYE